MNINPVLLKEMRVRMRGWRAAGIIILYLLVLTLVTVLVMYESYSNIYTSTIDPSRTVGTYTILALIQFILILFVAPALTSGAISGEREKQTLDLLLCTKLPTRTIILGKLLASMSQIILLIIASLPIFSVVFLFGGISASEVAQLFAFYIVTAIAAGSIGIFYSSHLKRTTASTVLTYGTGAFMILGTLLIAYFYIGIFFRWDYKGFFPLLYTNPMVGFASLLTEQFGYAGGSLNFLPGMSVANTANLKGISPWIINIIFDIVLTIVLIVLSARKINPVKRKLRLFRGKNKTEI
ncbi:MAG: ABC transporter permease [Bacillota bacterium]